jgi:hypothetical protein
MKIEKHWITIYPPSKEIGSEEIIPAKVNWCALGSVSPEHAIEFAHALINAAHEAMAQDKPKWTPAIPTDVREIVTLEYGAGTTINAACLHALKHAAKPLYSGDFERLVRFNFNGITLEAHDGLTVEGMVEEYARKLSQKRDRHSK